MVFSRESLVRSRVEFSKIFATWSSTGCVSVTNMVSVEMKSVLGLVITL